MSLPINKIICGDSLDILPMIPSDFIDSIITDAPYEISFMSKSWDNKGIAFSVKLWKEALRIVKPGAFMLIFGGTRTYHRLTCAIEDAGWQIRDCMMWLYGSGFPKSHNISKAIDKMAPRRGMFAEFAQHLRQQLKASGKSHKDIAFNFLSKTGGLTGCVWNWENGLNVPTLEQWEILQPLLELSDRFLPLIERIEAEREIATKEKSDIFGKFTEEMKGKGCTRPGFAGDRYGETATSIDVDITNSATDFAKLWDGYGTALKPAWEPIVVAMKPLDGTFAANAEKWGVAGLNIDSARIGYQSEYDKSQATPQGKCTANIAKGARPDVNNEERSEFERPEQKGRWPANLILNGEAAAMLDEQSGVSGSAKMVKLNRKRKGFMLSGSENNIQEANAPDQYGDSGGASRFFKVLEPEPCFLCGYVEEHGNHQVGPGVFLCDECMLQGETLDLPNRFLYCPKASRSERNAGLEGMTKKESDHRWNKAGKWTNETTPSINNHPTVKPLALMEYLCKLLRPPTEHPILLDPFCGSGTTLMAAVNTGWDYVGIEKEKDYCAIAEKRVGYVKEQRQGQMALFR